MALAAETKAVVAQFDYTDEDVNKGVQEFLRQMGESRDRNQTQRWVIPNLPGQARDWRRMAPA